MAIGETFGAELVAAGCANGVAWHADGTLLFDPSLSDAQKAAVQAVLAAHDPTKTRVPLVAGRQIMNQIVAAGIGAAWETAVAAAKVDYRLYWSRVGMRDLVPTDNLKMGRLLTAAGVTDVPAFFASAAKTPA